MSDELKREFEALACALSPENLTCDGELSRAQVRKRQAELNRRWRAAEKKAGRRVSEDEVWSWDFTHS